MTYIDKEFSNAVVRQKVNEQLKAAKAKPLVTLTDFHKTKTRIEYLCKLITAGNSEPGTKVTLDPEDLTEIYHGKRRDGHPRLNWYQVTLQDLWTVTKKDHPKPSVRFAAALDKKKSTHIEAIYQHAKNVHEKKENKQK